MGASEGMGILGVHEMSVSEPQKNIFLHLYSPPPPKWLQLAYIIEITLNEHVQFIVFV